MCVCVCVNISGLYEQFVRKLNNNLESQRAKQKRKRQQHNFPEYKFRLAECLLKLLFILGSVNVARGGKGKRGEIQRAILTFGA